MRYFILTTLVVVSFVIHFIVGTNKYDAKQDFQNLQASNIVKTAENITLLAKVSTAKQHPKFIEIFGIIDQNTITVTASMPSIVKSIVKEGTVLKKGETAVHFINGVIKPIPFDGTVLDTFVKSGDDVKSGDKLFIAVPSKTENTKVGLEVPLSYVKSIKVGVPVNIIHLNHTFHGNIIYVGKSSMEGIVKALVSMPFAPIPHNAVVRVQVQESLHQAHFVPKTAVMLGNQKTTVVKVILEDGTIQEKPVEVIHEDDDNFYITGLNKNTTIITVNPHYAINGKTYNYTTT